MEPALTTWEQIVDLRRKGIKTMQLLRIRWKEQQIDMLDQLFSIGQLYVNHHVVDLDIIAVAAIIT